MKPFFFDDMKSIIIWITNYNQDGRIYRQSNSQF